MADRSELLEYVVDQLARLGDARGRAMFGSHGLDLDGLITGIVVDETLYLKVDDGNRADYEAAGTAPCTDDNRDRSVATSYWEVPGRAGQAPKIVTRFERECGPRALFGVVVCQ